MSGLIRAVSMVLLFTGLPLAAVQAQNKCVDAKGKVTYQQDPCPGTVRAPVQPPAASAASPPPSFAAAQAVQDEARDMGSCADDWDGHARNMQANRERNARIRAQGRDAARDEMIDQRNLQGIMARFLPRCGKFGFEYPRDEAVEQKNSAIAADLQGRAYVRRAESEAMRDRERAAWEAPALAKAQEHERRECARLANNMVEARAALPQMLPDQRTRVEAEIARTVEHYNQTCQRYK